MTVIVPMGLLAVLFAASAGAQTLYKSIAHDGKVVYSDRPPTTGTVEKTLRVQDLPNTAIPPKTLEEVAALRKAAAASSAARAAAPVPAPVGRAVLFTASWCGYCRQAKAFLNQRGVPYEEQDIETPQGKLAFAQASGGRGVPLLLAQGQAVRGFDPAAYEALLVKKP